MPYSTSDDFKGRITDEELLALTDDAGLGLIDQATVSRAIAAADAEIDGYCGAKYPVPFSPVPALIKEISVDIAIYTLYGNRRGAPDDRKDRYDRRIRFLRDLANGVGSLGVNDPDGTPGAVAGEVQMAPAAAPLFGRAAR